MPPAHVTVTVISEFADLNLTQTERAGPWLAPSTLYPLAGDQLVSLAWLPRQDARTVLPLKER